MAVRVGRAGARPPRSADGFERGLEAAGAVGVAFHVGLLREVEVPPVRLALACERFLEVVVGLRAFELGHGWFCSFGLFGCLRAVVATTAEDHLHRVDGEVFAKAARY